MTVQHKGLATDRWRQMPVCEQMANIGSEVMRALKWRAKGNTQYSQKASARALELIDLSLDSTRSYSRLKEFARLRETVVDYFYGSNQFASSKELWRGYFDHFNYMARKDR